jgi:hypothetical protein
LEIAWAGLTRLVGSNPTLSAPPSVKALIGPVTSMLGLMVERTRRADHSYDVFISHASEDKDVVARPLATALIGWGWTAWLDELEMTIGDSLSGRIDEALSQSRFGVVILSPSFFAKQWPKRELSGLAAREVQSGAKVILPVWHRVDRDDIVRFSPTLADRLAAHTGDGIDAVASRLSEALKKASGAGAPAAEAPGVEVDSDLPNRIFVSKATPDRIYRGDGADDPPGIAKSLEFIRSDPCWCGSGKKYMNCHGLDRGLSR